jgi:deazaflavin-dependent oxidoreductase (nitroreductase family)
MTPMTPGAIAGRISPWQRRIQRLVAIGWVTRIVAPLVHAADLILLRLSGDGYSVTSFAIGLPVRLISTIGARTGQIRTHPLTVVPDGGSLGLIASNFGRPQLPGWCHNLRAHPTAQVRLNGAWRPFRAVEIGDDRRQRIWELAVDLYPGYADYARRASRAIPIFELVPDDAAE